MARQIWAELPKANRESELAQRLRAFADSGIDPSYASKLLAAAEELEARAAANSDQDA
ncbi:MAG TPA: hypothetical protein VGB91_05700 [Rhizomicrobium sp.]